MKGRRLTSPDREDYATRGRSSDRGLVTGRRRRIAARTRLDFWFGALLLAQGPVIIDLRPMQFGLNSMLDPANLPSLRHTVVIDAGAAAAVVIIDVIRRSLNAGPGVQAPDYAGSRTMT